jgi:diaminopropionate ammonia-lyase
MIKCVIYWKRGKNMILSDNTSGIKAIINNNAKKEIHYQVPTYLNEEELIAVKGFLWSHPKYKPTPLVQLSHLARELDISEIFIKDESNRFELDSFKIIGAITAIGKFICEKLGIQISQITFDELRSEMRRKRSGAPFIFTTATDGNHGKAVAWASLKFGQHAVIYLPKGTAQTRVDAIKETGAEAYVTDLNYDDTVEFCSKNALKNEWIVIQDTAWDGYTEIPKWIMQGYAIMGEEVLEQLNSKKPTHVFLQAGVGSMAGAVSGYFFDKYKDNKPTIVVIEPTSAACLFESVLKKDGKPHRTDGNLNTIMAGLSCGRPNPLA